jgi:hypothetical protein
MNVIKFKNAHKFARTKIAIRSSAIIFAGFAICLQMILLRKCTTVMTAISAE